MISLATGYAASRFIHVAAVLQLFGIGLFSEWLAPSGLRPQLRRAFGNTARVLAWLVWLTAAGILALQGGQMGQGWADTLRPDIWLAVLHTQFGEVWLWHLSLALAAVIITAAPAQSIWRQRGLLMASGAMVITLALTGHTASGAGLRGVLQQGNQILHLLAAGWWLGSLVPLLWCLPLLRQAARNDALQALIRFSRSGHLAVALVLLTGVLNGYLILKPWPLSLDSLYQRLLLAKVAVVVIMVLLAVTNRYRIVPAMVRHHPKGVYYLTMLTLIELALGSIVLMLVSLFATLEP